jgi:hypothetical protein
MCLLKIEMILNKKGESGVLLVVGILLLIAGIVVVLVTVNNARANPQNPDVMSIFMWTIIGYAVAAVLIVVGGLFIIFGARG